MKKILIIFLVFITVTSCQKLDYLNANNKDFKVVAGEAVFNGATVALLNQMFTPNVNYNNTMLFVQHFAETTYPDESRYDMVTRPIPATNMNTLYRTVLMQYKDATQALNAASMVGIDPKLRANQLAIIKVMSVFTWSNIVETYGDMPYFQALNFNIPNPKYDDGLTIYKDLILKLDSAITTLDPKFGGMGQGYDNIYGGTKKGIEDPAAVAKWIKFANTLKLRMGIMLSDIPAAAALAKSTIESASPFVFNDPITSPTTGDKFAMTYLPDSPNQNPVYAELIGSGRDDYVLTSTYVNPMNALNDPRRPGFLWTKPDDINYIGGPQGEPDAFTSFTHMNKTLISPTREVVLMDYTEAEFLLAEAVERGFAVGGTAASHYNNAIKSSINYWGGTDAQAATYLAQPAVAYATATGNWHQKIGTQTWYAYYLRGFTAWTNWRRLDYPRLYAPVNHVQEINGVPVRYTYAVSDQLLNAANYKLAAAAIGGDKALTRLFWDKGTENYDSSFK